MMGSSSLEQRYGDEGAQFLRAVKRHGFVRVRVDQAALINSYAEMGLVSARGEAIDKGLGCPVLRVSLTRFGRTAVAV